MAKMMSKHLFCRQTKFHQDNSKHYQDNNEDTNEVTLTINSMSPLGELSYS